MKRFLIAAVCALSVSALAEDKGKAPAHANKPTAAAPAAAAPAPAAAVPEAGSQMTCGQMMASKSALPAKMSELMASIAENMEMHAKWSGANKAGKDEQKAMSKIAKDHKALSASFKKTSDEMMKHKDMAGVAHDPAAMDPKMGETMTKQIALTREMANMMLKDADDSEKMMKAMAAAKPAGGM